MNPAILRLALLGSRGSWRRLVGIAAGVMLGVTLFLLLWGAYQGLAARDTRTSWMNLNGSYSDDLAASFEPSDSQALVTQESDSYRGRSITLMNIAAPPTTSLNIDGLQSTPRSGEYYASPALRSLVASAPADALGDRYGKMIGVIPNALLASPDSLTAVAGRPAGTLVERSNVMLVNDLDGRAYPLSGNYQTVTVIGGIAVLLPVLLLVSIVTQLGAAQRRERFATLRLIGAGPRVVTTITAWETAATSLIGGVAGVVLAWLLRPLAALVNVNQGTFFASDLTVSVPISVTVVLATVVASTLTAIFRIRSTQIGPLGATRQIAERRPTWVRLVPLSAGMGTLLSTTLGVLLGVPIPMVSMLMIGGFVLTALGLIVAGPYLTLFASRVMARFSRSAEGVIAANRIRRTPAATFRAVSGLVIAVFMVSVFAGAATTGTPPAAVAGSVPSSTLIQNITGELGPAQKLDNDMDAALATVERVPGVTKVATLFTTDGSDRSLDGMFVLSAGSAQALGFDNLPSGEFFGLPYGYTSAVDGPAAYEPVLADTVTGESLLFASVVLVGTDGTMAALERARTALTLSSLGPIAQGTSGTVAELHAAGFDKMAASYAGLAYLGIGVATFIAAFSLAISAVAAVLDRKRVLGLLRLLGMPVSSLRRIVSYEAAVPLLAVVALSIGLGFAVAQLILVGLTNGTRTIGWPDPLFLVALVASAALAAAAVVTTFGAIRRNTEVTSTRFE
ncbi:FtsX-like permease family protein [Cryobacterium lactosi]|uniref:FtsX-like permease family protein n=1 Tax=Cryobacterium lactosi TaxID=1259202 RepID=UPI00141B5FB4|nr:FtsX-like permease family protein [Cryobacterium lactosi]